MHIYDYIELPTTSEEDKAIKKFFLFKTSSAVFQNKNKNILIERGYFKENEIVVAKYEDKEYRVTGASRFGDIYLQPDFSKDFGYKLRVAVEKCILTIREI